MDPLYLSLISACTALVASIVGPLITLKVAKRQINATVISANRHRWIETLRDLLAELIALFVTATVVKAARPGPWNQGREALKSDPSLLPKLERIVLVQQKIRLMLNPNEPEPRELDRCIEEALQSLRSDEQDDARTKADVDRITSQGRAVLKQEWERVKRGD